MIPVLYHTNVTDFITIGLGMLRNNTFCDVTEERNGVFECLLKAKPNDTAADQAFRITKNCVKKFLSKWCIIV